MATLNGVNTKMRGAVGEFVYRRRNGKTVVSEKPEPKAVPPRNSVTMHHRLRWANVQHTWKALKEAGAPTYFENKGYMSDANKFMSLNLQKSSPFSYLTKYQASLSTVGVVLPYIVSQGSLPSIEIELRPFELDPAHSNVWTNIDTGNCPNVTSYGYDELEMMKFTQELVWANDNFEWGDALTFYWFEQAYDINQHPLIRVHAFKLVLDDYEYTEFGHLYLKDVIPFIKIETDQKIWYNDKESPLNGGFTIIHSRKEDNQLLVSTQNIVIVNPLEPIYKTEQHYETCLQSYGGYTTNYLDPSE